MGPGIESSFDSRCRGFAGTGELVSTSTKSFDPVCLFLDPKQRLPLGRIFIKGGRTTI